MRPSLLDMRVSSFLVSALLGCVVLGNAVAAPKPAIDSCVELASDHRVVRPGGSDQFLLRSGNDHYKVSLGSGCGGLAVASRLIVSTDGRQGRLCPAGSQLETGRDRCDVRQVVPIEAAEFERQQRRRR